MKRQEGLLSITVGEMLTDIARKYPDRFALTYRDRTLTYSQLDAETDRIAKGFLRLGIAQGTHVALWTENHPNTLICCYALLKIGAIPVFLGNCVTMNEFLARASEGSCTYLLFSEDVHGIPCDAVIPDGGLPDILAAYCINDGTALPGLDHIRQGGGALSDEELARAKSVVCPDDPDILLFTSGSSGMPKGVLLTHKARINNALALSKALQATKEDRFCCALPLFHCFAFTANAISALVTGSCLCFPRSGHTADVLQTIQEKQCTIFMGVPTMFSSILARTGLERYDLSSLRTGIMAGSCYPATLFVRACRVLNYQLLPAYGLTEATGGVTCGSFSDSEAVLSHSVGKPLPNIEVQLWDHERQRPSVCGEAGEILIRGYSVMSGYYGGAQTADSGPDKDGWFATGDIGRTDAQGNLYIVGRRKEIIIRGGENIIPTEIEDVILRDDRVADVKVVDVPDPHYIEEICACVIQKNSISEAEIQGMVRNSLGARKTPKYVLFFRTLPQNATGKIDSHAVRSQAMRQLGLRDL